jgi:hypothetical protein
MVASTFARTPGPKTFVRMTAVFSIALLLAAGIGVIDAQPGNGNGGSKKPGGGEPVARPVFRLYLKQEFDPVVCGGFPQLRICSAAIQGRDIMSPGAPGSQTVPRSLGPLPRSDHPNRTWSERGGYPYRTLQHEVVSVRLWADLNTVPGTSGVPQVAATLSATDPTGVRLPMPLGTTALSLVPGSGTVLPSGATSKVQFFGTFPAGISTDYPAELALRVDVDPGTSQFLFRYNDKETPSCLVANAQDCPV